MPGKAASLEAEIAHLCQLDLDALRARWKAVTARRAPPHLSKALLLRMLAYRIQADALGDLDPGTMRFLDRIAGDPKPGGAKSLPQPDADLVRPGAVLVREWEGVNHHVMALSGQRFGWNGRTFASLSAAARAITGTHWNGPRFFGLRGRAGP